MARFNAAFEKTLASHDTEVAISDKLRRRFTVGVAAVGLSAAAVFGSASANADEVLLFCGAGDSACNVEGPLRDQGYIAPHDNVHRVPGPYEIAPFVPMGAAHTARQSSEIAAANARAMLPNIHVDPGENLTFMGYSLGTIPAAMLANEHSENGHLREGVRNVVVNGPTTAEGIFNNEIVKMFDPIVQMIDVPTEVRAPGGSEVYGHEGDVWTYSAHDGLMELASKGINTFFGPVHAVQYKDGLSIKWVGPDGIEYTKFIGPAQGNSPMGVTMGNPMSAGEAGPVWTPAPDSFRAQRRDVVEAPVTNRATNSVAAPVQRQNESRPNLPKVERTERTVEKISNSGKKARVTSHVSIVAKPGKVGH